jgi:YD repeat-containing protein
MEILRRHGIGRTPKGKTRTKDKLLYPQLTGSILSEIPAHLPPARPITAFFVFVLNNRDAFQKKYPDLLPQHVTAKIGEIWRSMSMDEKKPYYERAEEEKQRYSRQKREFETQGFYYDDDGQVVSEIRRQGKRRAYDVRVAEEDKLESFGEDEEGKPTDKPKEKTGKKSQKESEEEEQSEESEEEETRYIPRTKRKVPYKKF